jgi:molecular chaperone DnaJ
MVHHHLLSASSTTAAASRSIVRSRNAVRISSIVKNGDNNDDSRSNSNSNSNVTSNPLSFSRRTFMTYINSNNSNNSNYNNRPTTIGVSNSFILIQNQHSYKKSTTITNNVTNGTNTCKRMLSSSSKEDFYKTLGVNKGDDKGTIKKAYFKLAKKYHPDTNKDDKQADEKFKKVTEAYETLSDDKQRNLYDTYGHAGVDPNSGFGQQGGNPFGGGGNPFGGGGGNPFGDGSFHFQGGGGPGGQTDPEDLFDAFFGGGRRRPRGPQRGSDLQMHINLSFKDAVFGTKQDLDLRYQIRDNATGRTEVKERTVECVIPAGIDTGMNLRLGGQGAEGDPGAPRGDLMVTVIVEEDEYFHREGADVHVEVPISVTQAILGGSVDVKTLTGEAELTIPKGCQPEAKMVMRGKGIPHLNGRGRGRKGNQIVHLKIEIPKNITTRQEELLREFDKEAAESGKGISGRLAEAAGSAFKSFFGSGTEEGKAEDSNDDKKSKKTKDAKDDNDNDGGADSAEEEKKRQSL